MNEFGNGLNADKACLMYPHLIDIWDDNVMDLSDEMII